MDETHLKGILPRISKVMVTGSTGFIGRHLVARLEALGKTTVCVSRRAGYDLLYDTLPFDGVEHVFHLAAQTGVMSAWEAPVSFVETNTLGTARILEQCRQHGCGLTYISAYVYGTTCERLPMADEMHPVANNPYALSKILAEQICAFYKFNYNVPSVILRPFNVYGPGQSTNYIIPFILSQIGDSKCKMIRVADLAPARDFIYISDVVDGILQSTLAEPGAIFDLGSGEVKSVEDIIRLAMMVSGIHKPYTERGHRRPNEVVSTAADSTKLYNAVGWLPRVSLDVGLRLTLEGTLNECKA
jgi:GDP-4-dehydro-6-deoxy-D-mannose reductase